MITIADADLYLWSGQMIRFQIIGETPSKKNSKIRTRSGYMIPSKAHQRWHEDAMLQLSAQICRLPADDRPQQIETPVRIYLTFIHGDWVHRDSDNQTASIMDLLQDAKVLSDDRWEIVREIHIKNDYEKNKARCLIEIERV